MGKISKALYLIDLLNTGNIYSVKELAKRLNISERMVRYYKEELEDNGIYIESFKGPNGGYFMLDNKGYYTKFNKYDIELLKRCYDELSDNNFQYTKKLKVLMEKVSNITEVEEEKSCFIIEDKIEECSEKLRVLKKYINNSGKLSILYEDIDGGIRKRIIHPLYLFRYHEELYVAAFCEMRNDIRHFEISRIRIVK